MTTKLKTVLGVLSVCLIFIIFQTTLVSAISIKQILGLEESESEVVKDKKPKLGQEDSSKSKEAEWATPAGEQATSNPQVNLEYVSLLVANMNEQERSKILADEKLFKQVIESEANNRSATSAAIANKLVQDRNVKFLMRRKAENVLRESYLNRLVGSKLPKGFPNDDQVAEYYESNKNQFIAPERVHVWQIFLSKAEGMDKKGITALKKKAEKLVADIKKGKADFSTMALSTSEHEQSRALGGYMGLLKTSELLPELKEPLLKLKEGAVSKPVESGSGIHILKRGKILKAEQVNLAKVETQIRQLLLNQANAQLRKAIFTQARKEYPQDISDIKLEKWRLRLRTNTNQ